MLSSLFSRARNPEEKRVRAWCRSTLGVTPGNLPLYRQALRHVSAVTEEQPDNERLEFLGDAVLDAVVGDLLFSTYPDQGEGFLTRMRSKLVSRTQLNVLAKRIAIERVIESNVARTQESSVPGNALEALIGALFLDKGFDRTRKVVVGLIKQHFDLKEIEKEDRDGKSRLLEWGQKRRKKVEFIVREEGGGGRGKHYVAEVQIGGEVRGTGRGVSKKVAEQDAAQSAFRGMRSRKPAASRPAEERNDLQRQQQPRHRRGGERPRNERAQ